MSGLQGRAASVAKAIARYIARHPRAADTAEGIRAWWVSAGIPDATQAEVDAALAHLVIDGALERTYLPNGHALFRAVAPFHANDA